ncbi:hypothetical protein XELAEV_18002156mg [Xenopus laevis]|uniref:Uncharacterized protein n=1 Tax=Xenopus laevis TaxID=8355 RepID=A0A974GZ85_XENLA|nr:hypothetical protein XELAEV_18002156mg [Xenopus laevis]
MLAPIKINRRPLIVAGVKIVDGIGNVGGDKKNFDTGIRTATNFSDTGKFSPANLFACGKTHRFKCASIPSASSKPLAPAPVPGLLHPAPSASRLMALPSPLLPHLLLFTPLCPFPPGPAMQRICDLTRETPYLPQCTTG